MTDYAKDSSIDPTRMEQWTMASKLPYQLTKDVTATRKGLAVSWGTPTFMYFDNARKNAGDSTWTISWPDAAERLRYREGEPWCFASGSKITCMSPGAHLIQAPEWEPPLELHRLAAILCDDAEGFRRLHWCIHNLCNTRTGANHRSTTDIAPDRGQE